ncbi:hypothetical protein CYL18_03005 [Pradoshia eiseniae]|uniref:Uncharacterized protein n=1 Tax=Pradoshia eiseniae TaxID=2064768 RepID=A0A2S7N4B4_9BACI|nr:hypothetical protein [Pradoshia eiseniae]PQD96869.1 hypothetical protein CYL18_03005 [Pradoshia eiseniae]
MKIISSAGYELTKEKPNSPEDLFNRSVVKYKEGSRTKELQILYVRYFEELLAERLSVELADFFARHKVKDCLALLYLMKNTGFLPMKKVYINTESDFFNIFEDLDIQEVERILDGIGV